MEKLRTSLQRSPPLRILICSPSKVTLAMLQTMLSGLDTFLVSSAEEAESYLAVLKAPSSLDFMILDDQSDARAAQFSSYFASSKQPAFQNTRLIHLWTPTTSLSMYGSTILNTIKVTKPPRHLRLLQALAHPGIAQVPPSHITAHVDEIKAQRTLSGHVLIAEGTPIETILSLCSFF
jgi:hypothetical protein